MPAPAWRRRRRKAAIVFAAFDSFDAVMVRMLRNEFPGIQVIGSTSAAEMSSAGGYQEDSVTLALFAADSVDFTTGMATIETDLRRRLSRGRSRGAGRHGSSCRGCAS